LTGPHGYRYTVSGMGRQEPIEEIASLDSLGWLVGADESVSGYIAESRSLALSLMLIAPLLLVYEVALVYWRPLGARRWVGEVLAHAFDTQGVIVMNFLVLLGVLAAVVILARRRRLNFSLTGWVLLESMGWAALLVVVGVALYRRLTVLPPQSMAGAISVYARVMSAVGAGIYEELLFRLVLASALYLAAYHLAGRSRAAAAAFSIAVSALVFAGCHVLALDLRPLANPVDRMDTGFHLLSGLLFGWLYVYRGLGVAVYTHVIYNIIVKMV